MMILLLYVYSEQIDGRESNHDIIFGDITENGES